MKQIIVDMDRIDAIDNGFKQLIEAKANGEFAVFEYGNFVNTTDDVPTNYTEMNYTDIASEIKNRGLERKESLTVKQTKVNSTMTIYKSIAKDALINWNGINKEEALNVVKDNSYDELESMVHASNSINYAIDGLAKVLNLSFMEKQQFAKAVFEGPEDAEILKEVTNKAKGLTNEKILDVLTTIHDGWVKDNADEKTFEKKKNQHKLRQYAPTELIGWKEVESDMLFLKPILDSLNVSFEKIELKETYENRMSDFCIENNIWCLTDPVQIKFHIRDNLQKIYPNIPAELVPKLAENFEEVANEIVDYLSKSWEAYNLTEKRVDMSIDGMKDIRSVPKDEKASKLLRLINAYKAYYNDQLKKNIAFEKDNEFLKVGIGHKEMDRQGIVSKYITRDIAGPYGKLVAVTSDSFANEIVNSIENDIRDSYKPAQPFKVTPINKQAEKDLYKANIYEDIKGITKDEAEIFVKNVNRLISDAWSLGKPSYSNEYSAQDLYDALSVANRNLKDYREKISDGDFASLKESIPNAMNRITQYQKLVEKRDKVFGAM